MDSHGTKAPLWQSVAWWKPGATGTSPALEEARVHCDTAQPCESQECTVTPWHLGEPSVNCKHDRDSWKPGNHFDTVESHGSKCPLFQVVQMKNLECWRLLWHNGKKWNKVSLGTLGSLMQSERPLCWNGNSWNQVSTVSQYSLMEPRRSLQCNGISRKQGQLSTYYQ